MRYLIIGSGKIGIDLYIKLKKLNLPGKTFIFNRNKNSVGGKYCRKKNFNYSPGGINHLLKFLKEDTNIIFDCTSADVSKKIYYKIKDKLNKNFYVNLTPAPIGKYFIPYFSDVKIPHLINMITCGGQSSVPVIIEMKKAIKDIKYVEVISSIASQSAGKATRENINEYIINTQRAIGQLSGINKNKVIINLNPSNPPVNMMNSIFFECENFDKKKAKRANLVLKKINKTIKKYIPGYNAKLFYQKNENIFRVTIRVVGSGDYLSTFAGNLDIITSSSAYIGKLLNEKYNY
jgi:acetaldehyde dehydrogenase